MRSSILIAAVATIACFFSVAYVSCTKTGDDPACTNVVCLNSGYCKKGKCVCAVGYEDERCNTASVARYLKTWDVTQRVDKSQNPGDVGVVTKYTLFFKPTATPTTFFINNFLNDNEYNQIVAVLDSSNSVNFYIDTLRPIKMWFDQVTMLERAKGTFNPDGSIDARLKIRKLNRTYNFQIDEITWHLTPHNF